MSEDQAALRDFTGVTRLFPLPGLVLFPHAVQALHIFEPRYRQMTADALADDRLIALILLRPGWEDNYDDRPAVHPVACLGRVVADHLLPDGRYNLMVRGLARVRLIEEPPTDKLYRVARAAVLPDVVSAEVDELMGLRTGLADLILPREKEGAVREQLLTLFQGELPLGRLCDVLAFALPLPPEAKQELLEEPCVPTRARRLMEAFRALVGAGRSFPPAFSAN